MDNFSYPLSENAMYVAMLHHTFEGNFIVASGLCKALFNRKAKTEEELMKLLLVNIVARATENDDIDVMSSEILINGFKDEVLANIKFFISLDIKSLLSDNIYQQNIMAVAIGAGIKAREGYEEIDELAFKIEK